MFPISRDPPEGGTVTIRLTLQPSTTFPISRDPPEGGTFLGRFSLSPAFRRLFPISRDPPEGGTIPSGSSVIFEPSRFQFLGIPPKGELT